MRKLIILITTLMLGSQAFAGVISCVATQANDQSVKLKFQIDYMPPASIIIFDESLVEEADVTELVINFSSLSIIKGERLMAASAVTPNSSVVGADFRFKSVGESFKNATLKVGLRDVFGLIDHSKIYTVQCN